MENVKIIGCGYAYGSNCVTNDMLKNVVDTSDEWIQSRTGIKQRTVSKNENTSDLAIRAAKKAIEENHIDKHEISLIIVATCTPDNVTPSCACLVQEALGLNEDPVMAFDINAACSGFIYALQCASRMLDKGIALVIGAETLSKILDWKDRNTCVLFGDGAGAVLIKRCNDGSNMTFYARSKGDKDKALYFLLIYGLAMFVVAFPISDKIHFYIGAIPTIVLMSYLLSSKITNIIENKMYRFCFYYVKATIYVSLLAYVIINSGTYLVNKHNYSDLAHYQYIIVDEKLEENIEKVDTFILTSKDDVKILDASAALYMIPIDKYNKNYDLLLKGNLGEDGEEKIIAEIESSKDVKYLILQDKYHKNWQTPLQVINYVKENKNKTGTIGDFDIYE